MITMTAPDEMTPFALTFSISSPMTVFGIVAVFTFSGGPATSMFTIPSGTVATILDDTSDLDITNEFEVVDHVKCERDVESVYLCPSRSFPSPQSLLYVPFTMCA